MKNTLRQRFLTLVKNFKIGIGDQIPDKVIVVLLADKDFGLNEGEVLFNEVFPELVKENLLEYNADKTWLYMTKEGFEKIYT